jgi:hypothetical protein
MKPLRFTAHALGVMWERNLDRDWIERAVRQPSWGEADPVDPSATRLFAPIPERGSRILRVVVVETATEIRILTAFLDRRARMPE